MKRNQRRLAGLAAAVVVVLSLFVLAMTALKHPVAVIRVQEDAAETLNWLMNASLQAVLLVPVILLVQWLLRHRLTARWRFALWWLLIVRLLLPVSFASPWSIFNYVQPHVNLAGSQFSPPTTADMDLAAPVQFGRNDSPPIAVSVPIERPQAVPPAEPSPATPLVASEPTEPARPAPESRALDAGEYLISLIWAVWFLVALALMAVVGIQSIAFSRRLRAAWQHTPALSNDLMAECRRIMGIHHHVALLETEAVTSPVLYGLFRHRILLPRGFADRFSPKELRHVLLHELAHVKRGDLWLNWLVTALQIVHWFNPLVWLGFARLRADRELACDELALLRSGADTGRDYGQTMLKLLEDFARPKAMPGLVGILEDKQQMQRRVRMIARFKQPSRWSALALILIAALGLVLLTDAQVADSTAPEAVTAEIGQESVTDDQPNPPGVEHPGEGQSANLLKSIFEMRLVESEASDDTETLPVLRQAGEEAPERPENLFVRKEALLDVSALFSAKVGTDQFTGRPVINLEFTAEGQARFAEVTRTHVGRQLAFVVDGQVLSAPHINEPITGGKAVISGSFTHEEAERLARSIDAHITWKPAVIVPAASSSQAPARFLEIITEIEFENWDKYHPQSDPLAHIERHRTRSVIGTNSWMIESDYNGRFTRWFTGTRIIARGDAITGYETGDTNPAGRAGVDGLMGFDLPAAVTWQAFGSGPAHRQGGAKLYPPGPLWEQARLSPAAWSESTDLFNDNLGLPKAINIFTTDGHLIYQYEVFNSTNVLGWSVPTGFRGMAYRQRPGRRPAMHLLFAARVTAISPVNELGIPERGGQPNAPVASTQPSSATNLFNFGLVTPAQALDVYRELTGRELIVSAQVTNVAAFVGAKHAQGSREEVAQEIKALLLEQAGLVITELDGNRASVTHNEALSVKPLEDPTGRQPPPLGPDGKDVIKPDARPRFPPRNDPGNVENSATAPMPSRPKLAQFLALTTEIEIEYVGRQPSREAEVPPGGSSPREHHRTRSVIGTNSWMIESDWNGRVTRWFTGTRIIARGDAITSYETGVTSPASQAGVDALMGFDLPAAVTWQAFGSGPAHRRGGAKLYPPSPFWEQARLSPAAWSERTELFNDSLGLPKSIQLVTADGESMYEYQVLSSTNVLGWSVPTGFKGVAYRQRPGGKSAVYLSFEARVTAISPVSELSIPKQVRQVPEEEAAGSFKTSPPSEPAYP